MKLKTGEQVRNRNEKHKEEATSRNPQEKQLAIPQEV